VIWLISEVLDDLKRTHIIVNAEAGHGKSSAVRSLVHEIKQSEPKTIIKVFDIIAVWWNKAPLPHRQKITFQMMKNYIESGGTQFDFMNINDCVYEIGDLSDEFRKYFISLIIQQDFKSRKKTMEDHGEETIKKLPRIIYIFEEADIYFKSSFLNSSHNSAQIISEFVKTGRNLGMRGICIVTAAVGELGTKLRRRSKHLIGKIISDSDQNAYNKLKKWKTENGKVGLGDMVCKMALYHWIYYNGEMSQPFKFDYHVFPAPKDFIVKQDARAVEEKIGPMVSIKTTIIVTLLIIIGLLILLR